MLQASKQSWTQSLRVSRSMHTWRGLVPQRFFQRLGVVSPSLRRFGGSRRGHGSTSRTQPRRRRRGCRQRRKPGPRNGVTTPCGDPGGEKREVLRKFISAMLEKGLVSPSSSSSGAPVLIVPKTNGGWRFNTVLAEHELAPRAQRFRRDRAEHPIDALAQPDSSWRAELNWCHPPVGAGGQPRAGGHRGAVAVGAA